MVSVQDLELALKKRRRGRRADVSFQPAAKPSGTVRSMQSPSIGMRTFVTLPGRGGTDWNGIRRGGMDRLKDHGAGAGRRGITWNVVRRHGIGRADRARRRSSTRSLRVLPSGGELSRGALSAGRGSFRFFSRISWGRPRWHQRTSNKQIVGAERRRKGGATSAKNTNLKCLKNNNNCFFYMIMTTFFLMCLHPPRTRCR